MSAPTPELLWRTAWMDYEDYFDVDYENDCIVWHDDAPQEALDSYYYYTHKL